MRLFKNICILLFVVGVLASIYLHYHFDRMVKVALESYGSQILGVEVKVDDIAVSFHKHLISIKGLKVANPKGFKGEYFFKASYIEFHVDFLSIFKDTIKVNRLSIQEPMITYDGAEGNNVKVIIKNLEDYQQVGQNTRLPENASQRSEITTKRNAKLIIHEIIVQNAFVKISINGLVDHNVQLENFSLYNIGIDEGGIKADKITEQLIEKIISEIEKIDFKEIFPNLVGKVMNNVSKGVENHLKKVSDTLDNLLNNK